MNHPPPETTADGLLARDLALLSVQERSKALDEIHGVAKDVEEDPQILMIAAQQLNIALQQIVDQDNHHHHHRTTIDCSDTTKPDSVPTTAKTYAYQRALEQDPEYVKSQFLQTCLFACRRRLGK